MRQQDGHWTVRCNMRPQWDIQYLRIRIRVICFFGSWSRQLPVYLVLTVWIVLHKNGDFLSGFG